METGPPTESLGGAEEQAILCDGVARERMGWKGTRGRCALGAPARPALPHPRHTFRCLEDCGHGVCSGPPDFTCVCDLGWTSDLPPPTPAPGPPAPRCSRDCGCNFHSHCHKRGPGFCDECQGERPHPQLPGLASGTLPRLRFPFSAWASGSPHPALGPPAPLPAPDPKRFQCQPSLGWGLRLPSWGLQFLPNLAPVIFLWSSHGGSGIS